MASIRTSRTVLALLFLAAFASGCKPDAAVKDPALIDRGTRAPVPPAPDQPIPAPESGPAPASADGAVSGTIFFKGSAPSRTIDTSMDPACSLGGAKPTVPTEQYVVKAGKLANVFLYVKAGPPEAMSQGASPEQRTAVLDQKHCQYVPHVIGVMAGGYVEFRNSDPTMHNIHTQPTDIGNETIDISEGPRGQAQTKQFRKPELMIPVRCNNHPWMNAFINVSATPFFAVSDANGHFDLRGLPPGVYTLGAVHEKLGEKTMQVTIPAHGTAKADFSFAM
jgi:plastocyanin